MIDQSHTNRKRTLEGGFKLYQFHRAINLHMMDNADYDFHKYNGRVKASADKFAQLPQKHRYCAAHREIERTNMGPEKVMYLLSKKYGGHVPDKAITPKNVRSVVEGFNKELEQYQSSDIDADIKHLYSVKPVDDFDEYLTYDTDTLPVIVKEFMAGNISYMLVLIVYNKMNRLSTLKIRTNDMNIAPIMEMFENKIKDDMNFLGNDVSSVYSLSRLNMRLRLNFQNSEYKTV